MNEISTPVSKYVSRPFRAPSSGAKARTVMRRCPRLLQTPWEGFSTLSSSHRARLQKNSMPAIEPLPLQKFMSTYLPLLLDSTHQILQRGEESDPDTSADGSHRQSLMWSRVT
jgi:hypothetical protein